MRLICLTFIAICLTISVKSVEINNLKRQDRFLEETAEHTSEDTILNCQTVSTSKDIAGKFFCNECSEGYLSVNNGYECTACTTPCKTCYKLSTFCLICIERYFKLANQLKCDKCSDGCLACDDKNNCINCDKGYIHTKDQRYCVKCTSSCDKCKDSMNCDICSVGFYKRLKHGIWVCELEGQQNIRSAAVLIIFGTFGLLSMVLCMMTVSSMDRQENRLKRKATGKPRSSIDHHLTPDH